MADVPDPLRTTHYGCALLLILGVCAVVVVVVAGAIVVTRWQ